MEPTTTAGGALLAKYGMAVFGFAGAVLSLAPLKGLTRWQAFVAVATGFVTSMAITQLVVAYFGLPSDAESKNGVAFLVGLLAMNIIPAIKAAAERLLATKGA